MSAQLFNLFFTQGDTPSKTIDLVDWPTSLDGYQASAQIRKSERERDILIATIGTQILTGQKKIVLTVPTGIPANCRPSQITQDLRAELPGGGLKVERMELKDLPVRPYFWDFQIVSPGGVITTLLYGSAIVMSEATSNA